MSFNDRPDNRMSEKNWLTLVDSVEIALTGYMQWDLLEDRGIVTDDLLFERIDDASTRNIIRCFDAELAYDDKHEEYWNFGTETWFEEDYSSLIFEVVEPMSRPVLKHKYSIHEAACICATYLYFISRGEYPTELPEYAYINRAENGMLAWYRNEWKKNNSKNTSDEIVDEG